MQFIAQYYFKLSYAKNIGFPRLDESGLEATGAQGIMRFEEGVIHLLLGLNADQYAAEMRVALAD